jgi:hypothetical protein
VFPRRGPLVAVNVCGSVKPMRNIVDEYDIVISDIIRGVEQLSRMQARRFPYYQSIEREGILLWKSTSEPMPSYA